MILSLFLLVDITVYALAISTHTSLPSPYTPHPPPPSHNRVPDTHNEPKYLKPTTNVCIVTAVDYNQLAFFLLANLLTGLVNFTVDTLNTGRAASVCILVLYMATLVIGFVTLHRFKIRIKL